MRLADPSFGIDRYALSLLAILSTYEPDFAEFLEEARVYDVSLRTDVYRSGTKNWVSLTLFGFLDGHGPRRVIAFGRDSFVDQIVVEMWDATETPELDEVSSGMARFDPKDLMRVALHIKELLASAYQGLRAPQA
jgi:hypothetical protein